MRILIFSILLCLGCALANPFTNVLTHEEIKKANKANVEVTIIESNLIPAEKEKAAVLLESILKHANTNFEVAELLAASYAYLAPNCIWSVTINSEFVYHHPGNGKTGYVLLLGIKDVSTRYFHLFSSPKNGGKACNIP